MGSVIAIGQFSLIFFGTFHYLCWDVMEPVCYLMTFANFCAGYFFYLKHAEAGHDLELTSLHEILTEKFTRDACAARGIEYDSLEEKKA